MRASLGAAAALVALGGAAPAGAGDPVAAEAQLRVASRLAAERAASAPAAYEKVVALDPGGPLGDDALLALARLYRPPESLERGGEIDAAQAASATAALTRLIETYPRGDRAAEARYLRAMVRSAPIAGRDPVGAREDLIDAAGRPESPEVASRARAALGALDEGAGEFGRASGAYARVLLDDASPEAVAAASGGLARTLMRAGRFGEAAAVLQGALDRPGGDRLDELRDLRTLAVRGLLRQRSPEVRWSGVRAPLPSVAAPRGSELLAARPQGGFVVYDRKAGAIHAYDESGSGSGVFPLADVTALAVDQRGRIFAAAGDRLVRIEGGTAVPLADIRSLAPARALVVDAAGTILLLDRKGERIARLAAGAPSFQVVREVKERSLVALAQDRGRAVAADEDAGTLVAIRPGAAEVPLGAAVFRRPDSIAIDAAGQLAVLDAKARTVTLLDAAGHPRDTLLVAAIGVERPSAIALSRDGALLVLDGETGTVKRVP